jgi:hypothetical protein
MVNATSPIQLPHKHARRASTQQYAAAYHGRVGRHRSWVGTPEQVDKACVSAWITGAAGKHLGPLFGLPAWRSKVGATDATSALQANRK